MARYRLPANPYFPKALDLLNDTDDSKLLLRQLVSDLQQAQGYVERAADLGETAFVLVTGGRGTGRTTISNHLLAAYRTRREIEPNKFFVPQRQCKGRDDHAIVINWFQSLYWALRADPAQELTVKEHTLDIDDVLLNGTNVQNPHFYRVNANALMKHATRILRDAHGAGFGVCLEMVEGEDVVNAVFDVFQDAETLVVLSPADTESSRMEVEKAFSDRPTSGQAVTDAAYPSIKLGPIAGEDAKSLIELRWRAATEEHKRLELPFAAEGVIAAFDAKPRTPGRVLELTAGPADEGSHAQHRRSLARRKGGARDRLGVVSQSAERHRQQAVYQICDVAGHTRRMIRSPRRRLST